MNTDCNCKSCEALGRIADHYRELFGKVTVAYHHWEMPYKVYRLRYENPFMDKMDDLIIDIVNGPRWAIVNEFKKLGMMDRVVPKSEAAIVDAYAALQRQEALERDDDLKQVPVPGSARRRSEASA